jgi:subtilisin-like proprotein convertase family protein
VIYGGYGDQDAVVPAADAFNVLVAAAFPSAAGVLVYDDTPAPQRCQVIYFPFSVEAVLDPDQARALVRNAAAALVAHELPPTASVAGRAVLAGQDDHSGITVRAGLGHETYTDAEGNFLLQGLYGGVHTVTASRDGYLSEAVEVELGDGEQLTGLGFMLAPIVLDYYSAQPELPIPDDDPVGVTSTIDVPPGGQHGSDGPLVAISVDIDLSHTWVGDLQVALTSPEGTTVVLHNRSGGSSNNLQGNWPKTLSVDGPGSLEDFVGEPIPGAWTLQVTDHEAEDIGVLHWWALNLILINPATDAPDGGLPVRTRLVGNAPNPFNPRTVLRFDLARAGQVELDIYDLRGRLVRPLLTGEWPAGNHEVIWDGRDGQGRALSSGTYLARLRADGEIQQHKMLLLR